VRLRTAQEVHDIVGHSLAVINMQAGVALHVLDRRPERAAEVLRTVRKTSAQALAEVRVALGRPAVPAAVDLAGYRIVQESLTNVVRHAAASRAAVEVVYDDGMVTVTVTDDGRGPRASAGTGRGLVGMRERAAAVGGSLTAGAGPAGGFQVRAALPLTEGGGLSTAG